MKNCLTPTDMTEAQTRSRDNSVSLKLQLGFNMIELIIAIAILAILIALAAPTFTSIINSNRLAAVSNEFLGTVQGARIEAVRRNARVVVCKSTNADAAAPTCSAAAGNWSGWVAFVDDGGATPANARNGVLNAGETVLRADSVPDPMVLLASPAISATQTIVFRSDGLAHVADGSLLAGRVSACLATGSPAENVRLFAIGSGSRMSISKSNGSGACNAPTN
jgi:type IV fimbrial biogenesis protein FimT